MDKKIGRILGVATIVIGCIILGSSLISIVTAGLSNLTIAKLLYLIMGIFFGACMIIVGCVGSIFLNKNE